MQGESFWCICKMNPLVLIHLAQTNTPFRLKPETQKFAGARFFLKLLHSPVFYSGIPIREMRYGQDMPYVFYLSCGPSIVTSVPALTVNGRDRMCKISYRSVSWQNLQSICLYSQRGGPADFTISIQSFVLLQISPAVQKLSSLSVGLSATYEHGHSVRLWDHVQVFLEDHGGRDFGQKSICGRFSSVLNG